MLISVEESGVLEFFWRHPLGSWPERWAAQQFLTPLKGRSFTDRVALGDVVVLLHRGEQRWPGTRLPIVRMSSSVLLLPLDKTSAVRNMEAALRWLKNAKSEDLKKLWEPLWFRYQRGPETPPAAKEIREEIKRLLESAELVPVYSPLPTRAQAGPENPVQPGPAQPGQGPGTEPPAPNTFPPGHNPSAQLAALLAAAAKGLGLLNVCSVEDKQT